MLLVWGKRTYGATDKVGSVSVKTVFGHLWYLPLFPMASYYVEAKSGKAFELNDIRWRSAVLGYLRIWGGLGSIIAFFCAQNASSGAIPAYTLSAALAAAIAASYFYDKKTQRNEVRQLRLSMERNFGVALDPYECLENFQQEITAKARQYSTLPLDGDWHKQTIRDLFADKRQVELALLRARCERHDEALQQEVFQCLAAASRQT